VCELVTANLPTLLLMSLEVVGVLCVTKEYLASCTACWQHCVIITVVSYVFTQLSATLHCLNAWSSTLHCFGNKKL